MTRFICYIFSLLAIIMPSVSIHGQTMTQATESYNNFVRLLSNGSDAAAYQALYQSYETAMKVLTGQDDNVQARNLLKTIYPYLQNGAYFYSSQNNQQKTLQMAQAYVGLSVLPAMQGEGLSRNGNYVIMAKLAAFNTWNNHEYAKAIPYMQAYLSTGDLDKREDAYSCLGKVLYNSKDYTQAYYILSEGLRLYPQNLSMLSSIINTCMDSGNTADLQKYISMALTLRPSDEGLLNAQGLLYEKNKQYEEAIGIYLRIRTNKPQSLDVARHLSLDYYNAGVKYLAMSKQNVTKSQAAEYKQKAFSYLKSAEPILQDVMAAEPLSVKYACALATVYSSIGDQQKLQAINTKIAALGIAPVNNLSMPTYIALTDPDPVASPTQQPVQATPPPTLVAQQMPQPVTQQSQPQQPVKEKQEPAVPAVSDVDVNIPVNQTNNENTYAVIIANEEYNKVENVSMANNDGKMFAEYCHKVLGLPKENIRRHFDATSLDMTDAIDDIKRIAAYSHGNLNVIFYYAGHGIPDEGSKDAYLLPVDANGQRTTGCISLNQLYKDLESLNAQCVTVFLDACFSGANRGDGMLASARGVAIKAKLEEAKGNMVIFSAATDAQTAMPYKEQHHGLFTYYLLKKLQESKGNITLEQLGQYLIDKVSLRAQVINQKPQTPTMVSSSAFGDRWKTVKLIK